MDYEHVYDSRFAIDGVQVGQLERAFESLGGALRARMRTRSSGLSESADASGSQSAAPRAKQESLPS